MIRGPARMGIFKKKHLYCAVGPRGPRASFNDRSGGQSLVSMAIVQLVRRATQRCISNTVRGAVPTVAELSSNKLAARKLVATMPTQPMIDRKSTRLNSSH